ncbi:hypothetical protein [Aequorivita xiaoshiensis]|uniref:Lipoprotein n=1 Tax=Aequorivita xiaoshiensis TaxID=2874476 RepID=A0A9X1R477_9FLAO|nr:hypothetical protein [Aequorivita xiaoshiensis]MCG2431258.1 hypothetical protein [Aequorivita xiaoshiensis]
MNKITTIIFIFISIFYSCSQETQKQNLIFTGKSIEDAIKFETEINSKIEKNNATIVLSPKLYPFVDKYELNNPIQISRVLPKSVPAKVEYFYDKNSREIKYVSYKWDFLNKVDDNILFDRKKLRALIEKECGELETYSNLFSELEEIINDRYSNGKKSVLQDKPKNKLIEWENDLSKGILKLELQDCSDTENLLPGWFLVSFIEYSK